MNPVVVIPTYWKSGTVDSDPNQPGVYDHATTLSGKAELEACLASLVQVDGLTRIILLLVADPQVHDAALVRVKEICAQFPQLPVVIIDNDKAQAIQEIVSQRHPAAEGETVSLRGYGAIKNMGLVVAAALGHDVVVFLDDDEVVLSPDFLAEAVYGLGQKTRQGLPIVAKSGYFLDRRNSPYADRRKSKWYNKKWAKRQEFNDWMSKAQSGSRISRSNIMCGGCFALHAEAYTRVAFDPWITRGEDQDYLINMRLYGLDVWFDNKWAVKHTPPREKTKAPRFMQNTYRWVYEYKKLEFANAKIDLHPVTPATLMPYPGPWVGPELKSRIRHTALMRALGTNEKGAYFSIFLHGWKRALEYAEANCENYLRLQQVWPHVIGYFWNNKAVANMILGMAQPAETVNFVGGNTAPALQVEDLDPTTSPASPAEHAPYADPAAPQAWDQEGRYDL